VRALVTGAAGFIGSHVVAALLASGAEVRGFDRRTPAELPAGAEFVPGELLDRDALRQALAGCDAVFHLAALYSYSRRDADAMEQINVEGTRALIEEAGTRRIVHTASCATCGPVAGRAATELDAPAAWELRVPYKRTKIAGERLALDAAARGANIVVVNPTTPVGPGDRRPTPTGKMVADVAAGRARGYLARGALGRRAPSLALPWSAVYGAAWVATRVVRDPKLLILDEVRVARWPMLFDDSLARAELGYSSEPARSALARAARAAV
jgi:dihydroflavonol-4-reductase